MSFNDKEFQEAAAIFLSVGFMVGSVAVLLSGGAEAPKT